MNCTEEFIAKMKQKDIVINFVQAWRNDTLEESYARWISYAPARLFDKQKALPPSVWGLPCRKAAATGRPGAQVLSGV